MPDALAASFGVGGPWDFVEKEPAPAPAMPPPRARAIPPAPAMPPAPIPLAPMPAAPMPKGADLGWTDVLGLPVLDPVVAEKMRGILDQMAASGGWMDPIWDLGAPVDGPRRPKKKEGKERAKDLVAHDEDRRRLHGAVKSLYEDQVKPTIGIIRRRIQELYDVDMTCKAIELTLGTAPGFMLDGKTSNHTALLVGETARFVDPLDPDDSYPEAVWEVIEEVVSAAAASSVYWRGGRYGCAQQLKALPVLQGYTLGQVQHIVQLAITKKLLGYKGGTLVAYELSRHGHKGKTRDNHVA